MQCSDFGIALVIFIKIEWKMACIRFPSWQISIWVVVVLFLHNRRKIACVRFPSQCIFPSRCSVFLGNECVFVIEGKLTCIIFPSQCNVAFGNALMLVLEGNLAHARFTSWCNVGVGNELMVVFFYDTSKANMC